MTMPQMSEIFKYVIHDSNPTIEVSPHHPKLCIVEGRAAVIPFLSRNRSHRFRLKKEPEQESAPLVESALKLEL